MYGRVIKQNVHFCERCNTYLIKHFLKNESSFRLLRSQKLLFNYVLKNLLRDGHRQPREKVCSSVFTPLPCVFLFSIALHVITGKINLSP